MPSLQRLVIVVGAFCGGFPRKFLSSFKKTSKKSMIWSKHRRIKVRTGDLGDLGDFSVVK